MAGSRTGGRAVVDSVRMLCRVDLSDGRTEQQLRAHPHLQPHGFGLVPRSALHDRPVFLDGRCHCAALRRGQLSHGFPLLSGQDGHGVDVLYFRADWAGQSGAGSYSLLRSLFMAAHAVQSAVHELAHVLRLHHRPADPLLVWGVLLCLSGRLHAFGRAFCVVSRFPVSLRLCLARCQAGADICFRGGHLPDGHHPLRAQQL